MTIVCAGKLTSGAALDPAGLVAVAVCHGFALFVAVSVGANISGGHVNPAVTFGLALGGQITILTGIFYWIAQLVGAIVACFLLKAVTGGMVRKFLLFFCNFNHLVFLKMNSFYTPKMYVQELLKNLSFIARLEHSWPGRWVRE